MTWSESVDEALCFGWIDGIRKRVDAESYCIRFTPRRPNSIWSAVNLAKVEALMASGAMQPAGLEAYQKRNPEKCEVYSFEKPPAVLPDEYTEVFKAHPEAWTFFQKQPPSYQKNMTNWITTAKQESTQRSRLQKLIEASEQKRRI